MTCLEKTIFKEYVFDEVTTTISIDGCTQIKHGKYIMNVITKVMTHH